MSSAKRKFGDVATKYYAVQVGYHPGVYTSWVECQLQITGFKGAKFKSFLEQKDAEMYAAGKDIVGPSASRSKPQGEKFYGVAVGHVTGVYENWDEAQKQILNMKGPKYRRFNTRAEAEEYVRTGGKLNVNGVGKASTSHQSTQASTESSRNPKRVKTGSSALQAAAKSKRRMVTVYTDGSSLGNGKVGARAGVGVYFGDGDPRNLSELLDGPAQTNQRAELTAIIRALQLSPLDADLTICTDSNYSINCSSLWYKTWQENNWRSSTGGIVMNKDLVVLIRELIDHRTTLNLLTLFEWIKGHSNNKGNEAADRLAVGASRSVTR